MAIQQQDNAPASTAVSDALEALLGEEAGQPAAETVAVESPTNDAAEPIESEAEPAAESVESTEATEQPASPAADLVDEAVSTYGLSKEKAEALGELLPEVLALMDRQAAQLMREELAGQRGEAPPPPQTQQHPEAKAPPSPIGALEKFQLPEIDRDLLDEGSLKVYDATVSKVNELVDSINQRDELLKVMAQALVDTHGTVKKTVEKTESETHAAFANAMDELFAELGEDFRDTYGQAPMAQLGDNPTLVQNRNKLVEEMRILEMGDARHNRPKSSTKQLAQRAIRALHADKEHAATRREVDKGLKAQRAAAIARPTGRAPTKNTDPESRKQNALAAIKKHLPKLGI